MTGRSPAPTAPGRTSRVADAVVFVAASALLGAVAGLPAAWVWAKVAHPPAVPLTEQGVVFGEVQLNQQSEVTLWFLVVGFGFGLVAGAVVGWRGERHGVVTVAAVLA
ncbi:MAG: hypothetical protein H0V07_02555, partial [Propionibacteriales bacterium]|nr:hypothetical protein [Propionibacteriales bacterium]